MLTVYRASAGSGKTFQLALEYIKLLLAPAKESKDVVESEQDKLYRRILAVTFTNKATDEMKNRIISELFLLAHTPEKSKFTDYLLGKEGITGDIDKLRRQAAEQLYMLLHDFSGLNISTIDRFFQQIARAFMYEAGLSNKYNIELDSAQILNEAVDQMFFQLEKSENKELLNWLLGFAQLQIEEEAYKNFRSGIRALANEIFTEQYKTNRKDIQESLRDKEVLRNFSEELRKIKFDYEREVKAAGVKAMKVLTDRGLTPEDFKGGNRSFMCKFRHWSKGGLETPSDTFIKMAYDSAEEWYTTRSTSRDIINKIHAAETELRACMQRIAELYGDEARKKYLTAVHTRKHLYTLGILNDITEYIESYKNEHGALLLSDTNDLLHNIIKVSDTPFVYEKIGTYIHHYFIDEFQDTSVSQWANFKPLIEESNANQRSNLIVGDVKQSIYRWRNSDWELLHSRLSEDFGDEYRNDRELRTNRRSAANIICFNNAFFDRASDILQQSYDNALPDGPTGTEEKIKVVYRNSAQELGGQTPGSGYVEVDFFDVPKNKNSVFQEAALKQIAATLRDLQDRGLPLNKTAILVRNKNEGNLIVQHLLREQAADTEGYRYNVISDEALYISNSPTVRLIIALLDYLNAPQIEKNRFMALYGIAVFHRRVPESEAISQVCEILQKEKQPEELKRIESLRGEPLYEVCEKIIDLYPVDTTGNDNVFIQAFLDLLLQYTGKRASDLNSFLLWWHDKGCTSSLAMSNEQEAIRIMTIHKSKGLEFDAVLIPFCNWAVDHQSNHNPTLWVKPRAPYDKLPIVPVTYDKALAQTIYSRPYAEEKMRTYIDNLNLAYVAFTRAKSELYIFTEKMSDNKAKEKAKGKELTISTIANLLQECIAAAPTRPADAAKESLRGAPTTDLHAGYDEGEERYTLGRKSSFEPSGSAETEAPKPAPTPYRSTAPADRLRLQLMGQRYFDHSDGRYHGTVYHDILGAITTADDIGAALQKHIRSGEITREEAQEMENILRRKLAEPEIGRWFAPGLRVLNEQEILVPRQGRYRPDRIVIDGKRATVVDYKFGAERKSHHRQVARYMRFVQEMGYTTEGYLWYVMQDKVVPVTADGEPQ